MTKMRTASRASAPFAIKHPTLGPLRELPGAWIGTGFNLVARPDCQNNKPLFSRDQWHYTTGNPGLPPKPNAPIIQWPHISVATS
jgi:hypothetical protein